MQAPSAYGSTERRISFQPHWRGKSLQYLAAAAIPVLVRRHKIIRGTLWVPTVRPARHVVGAEAERQVFCAQPSGLGASAAIGLARRCKGDSSGQLPLLVCCVGELGRSSILPPTWSRRTYGGRCAPPLTVCSLWMIAVGSFLADAAGAARGARSASAPFIRLLDLGCRQNVLRCVPGKLGVVASACVSRETGEVLASWRRSTYV